MNRLNVSRWLASAFSLAMMLTGPAALASGDVNTLQGEIDRAGIEDASGSPLSLGKEQALLVVVTCEGCRMSREQQGTWNAFLDHHVKMGIRVVEVPMGSTFFPGDMFCPGDHFFPSDIFFPGDMFLGEGTPPSGDRLAVHEKHAEHLVRLLGADARRNVIAFDAHGKPVFSGDVAGYARLVSRPQRSR